PAPVRSRSDRAGDERVEHEPEADDEGRAPEVSHLGRRLARVLRRALRDDVVAGEATVRVAPADDDVAPDLEERRRILSVVDDGHDVAPAVDVLQPEPEPARRVRVTAWPTAVQRRDDDADDGELARVVGELTRCQRGRRRPTDYGVT